MEIRSLNPQTSVFSESPLLARVRAEFARCFEGLNPPPDWLERQVGEAVEVRAAIKEQFKDPGVTHDWFQKPVGDLTEENYDDCVVRSIAMFAAECGKNIAEGKGWDEDE